MINQLIYWQLEAAIFLFFFLEYNSIAKGQMEEKH